LHVLMVPEPVAIARVHARVASGGHDVPTEKITARYQRLWALVADAVGIVDTATFWDNARRDGPEIVALFEDGLVVGDPSWPAWTPPDLNSVARWRPSPKTKTAEAGA
ncbi:MAG: ATPase, partial [Acidimicrobiia bacterium]